MADFQTKFKTECDQPYFRNTVRHIVHDETFVNNLLRNLSLQHQITNQVDKENEVRMKDIHMKISNQFVNYANDNNVKMARLENKVWWTNAFVFCAAVAASTYGGWHYHNRK